MKLFFLFLFSTFSYNLFAASSQESSFLVITSSEPLCSYSPEHWSDVSQETALWTSSPSAISGSERAVVVKFSNSPHRCLFTITAGISLQTLASLIGQKARRLGIFGFSVGNQIRLCSNVESLPDILTQEYLTTHFPNYEALDFRAEPVD